MDHITGDVLKAAEHAEAASAAYAAGDKTAAQVAAREEFAALSGLVTVKAGMEAA